MHNIKGDSKLHAKSFKDYKKLTTLIILCAKIQITSWYNDIKPQVTFLSPIPKWLLPQESWGLLACPTCSKCSLLLLHNMRVQQCLYFGSILVVISGGEKISVRILGVVCCVCNLRLVRGKKQALLLPYYCGHSKELPERNAAAAWKERC